MSREELLHSINNQLAIVMGRAELISFQSSDQAMKRRCEEIGEAAAKIKTLVSCMPEDPGDQQP